MLSWVIQITVISIILIFLVHHLINFFKSTLTVPKIKDLVNSPNQKYENMYNIIKNSSSTSSNLNDNLFLNEEYKIVDLIPKQEETPTMKNELKNFLKKQLSGSGSSGTEISALDSMMNSSYSNY
jgi:hypothetical protein